MPPDAKTKVLIVDDTPETRVMIQRMVQFDSTVEVVGNARTGKEAIEMAGQLLPDVILMDINMPDLDGISATDTIRKKYPFIQVIILSVQTDPIFMRQAMLAGARDYLFKPPMIDDLTNAIRSAAVVAHEARTAQIQQTSGLQRLGQQQGVEGKIIVVYSPKGGVGTTTVATNVAGAFKTPEAKVIIVDLNLLFGDVAVFLNSQSKNSVVDLATRSDELDPDVLKSVILSHAASGLSVLISPVKPESAETVTGEQISTLLKYLSQTFDYVVVDTSSYMTDAVQAALDVADAIVLVTSQEIASIKSCGQFLRLADASGISRKRILFVMNRFDRRIRVLPERVSEILKQEIKLVIPFEEKTVLDSINHGIPFVIEAKTMTISRSIIQLGDLLRERFNNGSDAGEIPARKI
jgi:pilus assembly protein CpaE